MNGDFQNTTAGGLAVVADRERISMLIPLLEADMHGGYIEEELLPKIGRYRGITWTVDLSAYEEGLTLSLAGLLAHLHEEAHGRGCVLTFVGLSGAPGSRAPTPEDQQSRWRMLQTTEG
jgi:hypothetical protein